MYGGGKDGDTRGIGGRAAASGCMSGDVEYTIVSVLYGGAGDELMARVGACTSHGCTAAASDGLNISGHSETSKLGTTGGGDEYIGIKVGANFAFSTMGMGGNGDVDGVGQ